MKKNLKKNGFIAISMIYSVFILFVTILIAIMFSYITDRKTSNAIKQDIKNRFASKLPEITYVNLDSTTTDHRFDVKINVGIGSFPVGNITYIWSKNSNAVPNKIISNGDVVSLSYDEEPGEWYLVSKACDVFDNCTVTISRKYIIDESATLVSGLTFNTKLKALATAVLGNQAKILTFRRTYEIDDLNKTSNNVISTASSSSPIYAFCEARNSTFVDCYYYTDAMKVKLNSDSSGMFRDLEKIQTIDLGDFDKSSVNRVSDFFTGCTDLRNIKTPLSSFFSPPITLPGTFYNDNGQSLTQMLGTTTGKMWLTKDNTNYTISYDLNGGSLPKDNKLSYNRTTETFTLNNPTREGYIFAGWSGGKNLFNYVEPIEGEGVKIHSDCVEFDQGSFPGNIASNIQLQVSLDDAENSYATKIVVPSSSDLGKKEATFLKDNTFNKYRLKINTNLRDSALNLSYMQLIDGKYYSISFNVDDYQPNSAYVKLSQVQIEEGNRATEYERYVDRDLKVTIPKGSQGNRHYVANWIPANTNTYTLTINPNGGSWYGSTTPVTKKLKYDDVFDIPAPTREGYVFDGWKEYQRAKMEDNVISGWGFKKVNVYNNAQNGVVTHTYTAKSADNPLSSTTRELKISHSGTADSLPGLGGFYQSFKTAYSRKYIHVIVAKVPNEYYLHYAYNDGSLGTGGNVQWLTSNRGDGTWKTYAYLVTTGSTGTVGNTIGFVYLSQLSTNTWNGTTANAENRNISMQIASTNIYDVTYDDSGFGMIDGSAKLTAKWTTPVSVTIDPYGSTYKGKTGNVVISGRPGEEIDLANSLAKNGYVFNGWTYSGSSIINYFDGTNISHKVYSQTQVFDSSTTTPATAYNNNNNGAVTTSMAYDSKAGAYRLKIVTNGNAAPEAGGIYLDLYPVVPERINVVVVEARIPKEYYISANGGVGRFYTGIGSYPQVTLGTTEGTNNYKFYYLPVYFGKTGGFKPTVYLKVYGSDNTSVTWYVRSVSVYSYDKGALISTFKLPSESETLTARWGVGGSRITFEPNGGNIDTTSANSPVKNWKNGYNVDGGIMRYYSYNQSYATYPGDSDYDWTPDNRVTKKEGYHLDGWYTDPTNGTKIFNGDGTLVPSVPGYSDSSGKWIKYDENITLYAHWAPNTMTIKYYAGGATHKCKNKDSNNVCGSVEKINNQLIATENYTYNYLVGQGWPADYFYPYSHQLIKYGYKSEYKYHIGSATSSSTINTDLVPSGGWYGSKLSESLGKTSEFKTGDVTVNIYGGWYSAFVDNATISSTNGAYATGSQYSNYMATQDYFPVQGGTTLTSNYTLCGVYSYRADYSFIRRETNRTKTHTISSDAKFVRFEIDKTQEGSHDANWWTSHITIE